AHTAFAILFLCYAVRLGAGGASRARARAAGGFVGAFCIAWAATTNPAQVVVLVPVLLVGLALLLHGTSSLPRGDAAARRAVLAAGAALALLVVASDGWLQALVFPTRVPGPGVPRPPSDLVFGWSVAANVARWLGDYALLGVVPDACIPGPHCPGYLVGLLRPIPLALALL